MIYASLWFKDDVGSRRCEKAGVYAIKTYTITPSHCNSFFRFSYKISSGMLSRWANLSGLQVKTCIKACWWGLPMGFMRNIIMVFSSSVNQWEWTWYSTFNRYTELHHLLSYSQIWSVCHLPQNLWQAALALLWWTFHIFQTVASAVPRMWVQKWLYWLL